MGKESKFESDFRENIEELGGICLKIRAYERGWMDRCILMPKGFTYWCELKRPDGKGVISPMQTYQIQRLSRLGHDAWLIDSEETKQLFLQRIQDDQHAF